MGQQQQDQKQPEHEKEQKPVPERPGQLEEEQQSHQQEQPSQQREFQEVLAEAAWECRLLDEELEETICQ